MEHACVDRSRSTCTSPGRWVSATARAASGGAAARAHPSIEVEGTNFEVTGGQELIKHFTQEGFSGVGFCSNCGSSLYAFDDGKYYVSAGTLQDVKLQPEYHMMVAYKAPWDEISGDAPQYPEFPPED